jgi:hypothetical protein
VKKQNCGRSKFEAGNIDFGVGESLWVRESVESRVE